MAHIPLENLSLAESLSEDEEYDPPHLSRIFSQEVISILSGINKGISTRLRCPNLREKQKSTQPFWRQHQRITSNSPSNDLIS